MGNFFIIFDNVYISSEVSTPPYKNTMGVSKFGLKKIFGTRYTLLSDVYFSLPEL